MRASQVWWELKQDAPKSGAERLAPVRKTRRHRLHVLQSEPVRDSLVRFHGEQEILSGAVCPALQCLLRRESIEAVVDFHRREAGRVEGQEPSLEKVLGVEAPSPFLSTRIPRYRWRRDPNSSEVPPDPRPPVDRTERAFLRRERRRSIDARIRSSVFLPNPFTALTSLRRAASSEDSKLSTPVPSRGPEPSRGRSPQGEQVG